MRRSLGAFRNPNRQGTRIRVCRQSDRSLRLARGDPGRLAQPDRERLASDPEGGTVLVIAGPGATLTVRDGGPGLTADQLSALVQRHARADSASRSGAGLGLAIVDQIMRAHGGTLTTDPEARKLTLTFPPAG